MWLQKNHCDKKEGVHGVVAVAIDNSKGSRHALQWATEHLLTKSQTVVLIHVKLRPTSLSTSHSLLSPRIFGIGDGKLPSKGLDDPGKEIFHSYHLFCARKDIRCKDILLEDVDVAKALTEYASQTIIEHLVLGYSSKSTFLRFKVADIPGLVSKGAPDFCTVYVVSKGKIHSTRSASRPAPSPSPLLPHLTQSNSNLTSASDPRLPAKPHERRSFDAPRRSQEVTDTIRSPLTRKGVNDKSYAEMSWSDTDITFVSSERSSIDRMIPSLYLGSDAGMSNPRLSYGSDINIDGNYSFESVHHPRMSMDSLADSPEFSYVSHDIDGVLSSSHATDDVENEMRRLKLELKQTMEMYSTACKEALTAKQKAIELQRWKLEEERKLEEAKLGEETALAIVEMEKAKAKAAIEAAEAQKRIAELEAQKRLNAEMKAIKEAEAKKRALDALAQNDIRCRKYSIEEIEAATNFFATSMKIGEGGYGPVFKCLLDHTPVAVKVLRPDAAQGRSQFQREVEVLSCIRHPNMVLLLGACPEYGCLVYEYMANGSLEDRLFCRGDTPPLPWQIRFKIAAEIGTGLLFLHQTKPEPLVHRDLKPANILLDRNCVAKISDVGLARLVPPSVADSVTQYHMTSAAGTFCYIDPEYQQTGMLGVKSDIYSLGIIFLQILTGKPPMGLAHQVEKAIEKGTLANVLDPKVPDWPMDEALSLAKISIKCAELRRKDRPDLGKEVLPILNSLRSLAENGVLHFNGYVSPSNQSQVSVQLDEASSPSLAYSEESPTKPSISNP
ncbi:hypothetical protein HN51_017058 [Arachis hypogaea]|uniref:RING-type E3 ubiquitin transferase n=1 Tax=Arachis hypogaea TaxID=3818 RepID=A0A445CVT3_ARAHY|nr:U-box domain-containing protein [Arachis hypogaea]RYR55037.1 hypothetical protein Ahy_A06g030287 [Arachis hypogaea]